MAVEKEKVIARFRAGKFRNVPITNQRLDAIATKLATKIPDEADDNAIDLELDDLNDLLPGGFMEVHKNDQRQDNEKKKQKQNQEPTPDPNPEPEPDSNDLAKLIAAAVTQAIAPISEKLNNLEAEKQQQTKRQRATSLLPGVSDEFLDLVMPGMPDDEEGQAAWAEKGKSAFTAKVTADNNANLGPGGIYRAMPPDGQVKEASKEEVGTLLNHILPK